MKISIRVKPNSRKNEIVLLDDGRYQVSVTAPPTDGKANEKVIELLAKYFGKPKRCITIFRGETSKNKIININEGH